MDYPIVIMEEKKPRHIILSFILTGALALQCILTSLSFISLYINELKEAIHIRHKNVIQVAENKVKPSQKGTELIDYTIGTFDGIPTDDSTTDDSTADDSTTDDSTTVDSIVNGTTSGFIGGDSVKYPFNGDSIGEIQFGVGNSFTLGTEFDTPTSVTLYKDATIFDASSIGKCFSYSDPLKYTASVGNAGGYIYSISSSAASSAMMHTMDSGLFYWHGSEIRCLLKNFIDSEKRKNSEAKSVLTTLLTKINEEEDGEQRTVARRKQENSD